MITELTRDYLEPEFGGETIFTQEIGVEELYQSRISMAPRKSYFRSTIQGTNVMNSGLNRFLKPTILARCPTIDRKHAAFPLEKELISYFMDLREYLVEMPSDILLEKDKDKYLLELEEDSF
jgi:hypothetical protein